MNTRIWKNPVSGHQYEDGEFGRLLNGNPVTEAPQWAAGRDPDFVFAPARKWDGGECPVDPQDVVRCLFRGRLPYVGAAIWDGLPDDAKAVMWRHAPHGKRINPDADIIAYQVRVA